MNKHYGFWALVILIAATCTGLAFEDKPALTGYEKVFRAGSKITGAGVGTVAGLYGTRKVIGSEKFKTTLMNKKIFGAYFIKKELIGRDKVEIEKLNSERAKLMALGLGPTAIGVTGYVGYHGGKLFSINALAKYHGVSYSVESVSQFYDINLGQYGQLLIEAQKRVSLEYLNQIINQIYSQRFGANWKERLSDLFSQYGNDTMELLADRVSLTRDQKDFIRMVELGAAMANLYFKHKQNVKNMRIEAVEIYKKLGILH